MTDTPRKYVQSDGTVSSVCPHCGAPHLSTTDKIRSAAVAIDVQCSCGEKYSFLAEFRRAYRRPTNIPGAYAKTSPEGEQGKILIKNMSMTGIGFTPAGGHAMTNGDQLSVRFVLTDENQTEMEVPATVVYVNETMIGCTFQSLSPEQEEALATFLMNIS